MLQSQVDMALLRRVADDLGLDLVLVAEGDTADLARLMGLRVAPSEERAQRVRSQRRWGVFTPPTEATPDILLPSYELPQTIAGGERAGRPRHWRRQIAALAGAYGLALLLLLGLALLVPSATIVLDPEGSRVSAEAEVMASVDVGQVDYEHGWVPARLVEIEAADEEEGQATGRLSIPDQHAQGEVVFANKSVERVVVPKGTVVRTDDGVLTRFYTLLDVEVPGTFGATARVPILAFEPGPRGNVDALTIRVVEGDASYYVEVLNDQPTHGGGHTRVSIVSRADYDRLRANLVQRLQGEAYDLLVQELEPGEWVPPDTIEVAIVEEVFDKLLDEPADTLRLTMKVRVTGVAVQGQATKELMARQLEIRDGEGRMVNEATLRVEQPVGMTEVDGQLVRFKARASAMLVRPIDQRAMSMHLAGQDLQSVTARLSGVYALQHPPEIRIWPSWWPRLPWLPWRIRIEFRGGL
jgi:hypothetical protein